MKQLIIKFYNRDRNALMSIARCGHVTDKQLSEFVKDKRIYSYNHDGLTEKTSYTNSKGEQFTGYKLTDAGKSFVSKNYGFKDFQKAQSLHHDMGISNKYFSINSEQRETWNTETKLQNDYKDYTQQLREEGQFERAEKLEQLYNKHMVSCVDCSYTTEGQEEIFFEVTTNSYGQEELQQKIRFVEVMKEIRTITYQTERV